MSEGFQQPSLIDASVTEGPAEVQLPGAALRAERESRDLTMEAVAQATRFGVRQVAALERDDYASLPGMTADHVRAITGHSAVSMVRLYAGEAMQKARAIEAQAARNGTGPERESGNGN